VGPEHKRPINCGRAPLFPRASVDRPARPLRAPLERRPAGQQELLGDRAQRERGQYCSAVMIATTPSRKTTNVASFIGTVLAEGLAFFFDASDPAIARIGMA
jgi:hypothetical protein